MDTYIGAEKYLIKSNMPGYVSQAYPTRILSDTHQIRVRRLVVSYILDFIVQTK
jgi:hypothetical protein